jgi:hypothetical protein
MQASDIMCMMSVYMADQWFMSIKVASMQTNSMIWSFEMASGTLKPISCIVMVERISGR